MKAALIAFCICVAYLLGSINTSIIISKFKGSDIRNSGSGNAGATNTLRTYGKLAALIVVIFDGLKGVAAVLFAKYAPDIFNVEDSGNLAMYLSALFVMLGHIFPIFFQFKGGKGIATSVGIFAVCCWPAILIGLAVFALGVFITKIVSISSIAAALTVAGCTVAFYSINKPALLWPQALMLRELCTVTTALSKAKL